MPRQRGMKWSQALLWPLLSCSLRAVCVTPAGALLEIDGKGSAACPAELLATCTETCSPCFVEPASEDSSYNCNLPGLEIFQPGGRYEGVIANYLSFETETSSGYFPIRAREFEACTGGRIVFSDATNVFEDPVQDLGTKTRRGSELYDGYLMSYSHFPEVSALNLAEHLNDRIRKDNNRLKYEDMLPQVRKMGEYRTGGVTNIDFLMFDGDFFVPIIRLDLLEKFQLPIPNTWQEVVEYAKFFNGTDLNDDGNPDDFGFCHFPRLGAGSWDWWFSEAVYSTWATLDQTQGAEQGFFFDENSMEPRIGVGFREAAKVWRDLWSYGADSETDIFITGRCAIGFGPPGGWKKVFLGEDGVSRKDENGTVVWRPTMQSGEYAEPYRFKPFGSTSVVDRATGDLKACTPKTCPMAEAIPARGHHGDTDRAHVLPSSPLQGQLINRAPFYWSGGLGTLIRKSASDDKKDLLWDFFLYVNSAETSVYDVASYSSWIDSWRYSQLFPGQNFLDAGWSQDAYFEHADLMQWALSSDSNGALNLRIPGMAKYTRDVVGTNVRKYIAGQISLENLSSEVEEGWKSVTGQSGKLHQLEVYRASLGIDALSEVELCNLHRPLMDERDPSSCIKYDPLSPQKILVPILIAVSSVLVIALLACFRLDRRRKLADAIWKIDLEELEFSDPPEILGQGRFGSVVLAEYRGTEVAVKRAIPRTLKNNSITIFKNSAGDVEDQINSNARDISNTGSESSEIIPVVMWRNSTAEDAAEEEQMSGKTEYHIGKASTTMETDLTRESKRRSEFIAEMRQLSNLRHPSITTVMGAIIERNREPLLVMERMEHGSLHDLLHNETMPLDGDLILSILRDIAQGMRFLHAATPSVIHGDLKSKNILVDSRFRAKVADFGLSVKKKSFGATGTPFFMAPELLRGESWNTSSSDVYSYGICLFEVFSRKDPYEGEDVNETLKSIANPKINKRPPVPSSCPPALALIMADCVRGDAELRPSFEEVDFRLKRLDAESIPSSNKKASRNEDLLHKVFPKHIAEALRDGLQIPPDKKECVSIFFSDIVGFTNISATSTPEQVSDMLDRLYLRFDALSHQYDVFKMETIGDAYMGVTNMVKDQEVDHTKRIAHFAIQAIRAAGETLVDKNDASKGFIKIRVGFHCGPAIARVVGSRNPKYSMFGDTVNTASRMESNSLEGHIQCSEYAARLLIQQDPAIPIYSRGTIQVKGKGAMRTFFVGPTNENNFPCARTFLAPPAIETAISGSLLRRGSDDSLGGDKHTNKTTLRGLLRCGSNDNLLVLPESESHSENLNYSESNHDGNLRFLSRHTSRRFLGK